MITRIPAGLTALKAFGVAEVDKGERGVSDRANIKKRTTDCGHTSAFTC
jgi:hypothetical protein